MTRYPAGMDGGTNFSFRRHVLPSLALTVPLVAFWCLQAGVSLMHGGWTREAGSTFVLRGLAMTFALSGVASFFVGELLLWRQRRASRSRTGPRP